MDKALGRLNAILVVTVAHIASFLHGLQWGSLKWKSLVFTGAKEWLLR